MKTTMIEIGDIRILAEGTPQQVRDAWYPGTDLSKYQAVIPRSTRADAQYVQTWRVLRNGNETGIRLTEVP